MPPLFLRLKLGSHMQRCHLAKSSKLLGMIGILHEWCMVHTDYVPNLHHAQRSRNTDYINKKHLHRCASYLRFISLGILGQTLIGFNVASSCFKNSIQSTWISHTLMSVICLPNQKRSRTEKAKIDNFILFIAAQIVSSSGANVDSFSFCSYSVANLVMCLKRNTNIE